MGFVLFFFFLWGGVEVGWLVCGEDARRSGNVFANESERALPTPDARHWVSRARVIDLTMRFLGFEVLLFVMLGVVG